MSHRLDPRMNVLMRFEEALHALLDQEEFAGIACSAVVVDPESGAGAMILHSPNWSPVKLSMSTEQIEIGAPTTIDVTVEHCDREPLVRALQMYGGMHEGIRMLHASYDAVRHGLDGTITGVCACPKCVRERAKVRPQRSAPKEVL